MAQTTSVTQVSSLPRVDPGQEMFLRLQTTSVTNGDYVLVNTGFRPKSIVLENITQSSRYEWHEELLSGTALTLASNNLTIGAQYVITALGTSDWTLVGAPSGSSVGTQFIATATGAGLSGSGSTCETNDAIALKTINSASTQKSLLTSSGFVVRDRYIWIYAATTAGNSPLTAATAERAVLTIRG